MAFREHWLRCDCSSAEHSILLMFDPEDRDDMLYVCPHLTKQSFWRRLKYLFGFQSKYGAFEELVLRDAQVAALGDFLSAFRNRRVA